MGCEQSILIDREKKQQDKRKNRKKGEKIIGRVSQNMHTFQNAIAKEEKISSSDNKLIQNIISSHFFFSGFSHCDQSQLIQQMKVYETGKNKYLFKQEDPGSLFFIIKKGRVAIQINGQKIRQLTEKQSFGELSLIYTAPRSASVKTLEDCTFWCLHQNVVRLFTEDLMMKNYKIGKPFLEKIPIFKFLSKKQVNFIAYNMNNLKYQPDEQIFKQGDDANAFYIIISGKIKIQISGKAPIILKKGDSFGENSFKKGQVRGGGATAHPQEGAKLLSISRKDLQQCLGQQIQQLLSFNILRWAFKRSTYFDNMPAEMLRKTFVISNIFEYNNNHVLSKQGSHVDSLIISLDGKINQIPEGVLINEEYFMGQQLKKKQNKLSQDLVKIGRGSVMVIPIKKLQEQVLGFSIKQSILNRGILFQKKIKTQVLDSRIRKGNPKFNKLIKLKSLGEGQFGKVILVQDSQSGHKYALKCMSKRQIFENEMQDYVKNEKRILETTAHPYIVKLQKTFKNNDYIFLLLQYINGIDFFDCLRQVGLCRVNNSQFYFGCLLLGIQELHLRNIVYRDLKPQNAVIDTEGFLYMIDLGTAKQLKEQNGYRTFTIIGTPHYMAPEMVESKGYGMQVDIWSLGVMLYEMVCGKLPYGDELDDPYVIYKSIMKQSLVFPQFYSNEKGKSLIKSLLITNPAQREVDDFDIIKNHEYFSDFDWEKLETKKMKTPYKPKRKLTKEQKEQRVPLPDYFEQMVKKKGKSHKKKPKNFDSNWDAQF